MPATRRGAKRADAPARNRAERDQRKRRKVVALLREVVQEYDEGLIASDNAKAAIVLLGDLGFPTP